MCTGGEYRPLLHDRQFSAASSFQIGVLRGRRIASSATFAAMTFDFEPAVSAVEALLDGRRRLCGATTALSIWIDHASASARSASRAAAAARVRALRAYLRAHDLAAVNHLSRLLAHGDITAALAAAGNATRI